MRRSPTAQAKFFTCRSDSNAAIGPPAYSAPSRHNSAMVGLSWTALEVRATAYGSGGWEFESPGAPVNGRADTTSESVSEAPLGWPARSVRHRRCKVLDHVAVEAKRDARVSMAQSCSSQKTTSGHPLRTQQTAPIALVSTSRQDVGRSLRVSWSRSFRMQSTRWALDPPASALRTRG